MTKEELTNLDLDVMNLCKSFPENENDCYIYIRGDKDKAFACVNGENECFVQTLCSLMMDDVNFEEIVLTSALTFLSNNEKLKTIFEQSLKEILK